MKTMTFLLLACTLVACEKIELPEAKDEAKTKKITFNLKGDFGQAAFYTPTRGNLSDADAAMADLWLFDYMGDSCLHLLHFTPTDEQWGRPQLSLAYGSHSLYFVASCGITPQLNTTTNTISWERPKDTFWKKYDINVGSTTNANRSVALDRVATRLRILINDTVPATCQTITINLSSWNREINYLTGNTTTARPHTTTIAVPTTYHHTAGQLALSVFGLSNTQEWTADITLVAHSATAIIGEATINNAPFKRNRVTEYTGNLFAHDNPLSISLNSDWEPTHTATW